MAATGQTKASTGYADSSSVGTAGADVDTFSLVYANPFAATSGTGSLQFDVPYSDTGTLTATSKTYTLSALPGVRGGTSKVIAKLKEVVLTNTATPGSANVITLQPGGTHPFTGVTGASGAIPVQPGGILIWVAPDANGVPAVASSSDQLTINSGSGTVPYTIAFKGTSV